MRRSELRQSRNTMADTREPAAGTKPLLLVVDDEHLRYERD
jgi:hypothetical protein